MGMAARAARSYRVTGGGNPANPAHWLLGLIGGDRTAAGLVVDGNMAMHHAAVYGSCRNLGQDVGSLPLPVMGLGSGGKSERLRNDPVDRLLNRAANDEGMPASAIRGALQGQAALRGNGFAEIEFDGGDRPRGLWPLRTDKMRLVRNGVNAELAGAPDGQLAYAYTLPSGREKIFAPERILHLRGFGDGQWGHSVLGYASEGIGLALAAMEYDSRFYANDARPGLAITRPREVAALSPDARDRLKAEWEEGHRGLEKAHRIAILQEGMDLKEIGVKQSDAQFLETLRYMSSEVIGSFFRMPPDKLMDYSRATFTNVETSDLVYVKYTLRFWFVSWQQEIAIKLLGNDGARFAEHNPMALLQGDSKSRGEFYQARMAASSMTPNRIADLENEPRSADPVADQLLIPLNMIPSGALDANGMTLRDRVNMAGVLTRAGYDPNETLAALNLPAIKHSGLVPITVQVDPSTLDAGAKQ